jgi:hypothetical protein
MAQFFALHVEVQLWRNHGRCTGWTAPTAEQQQILLGRESFACCHSSCLFLSLCCLCSFISYAFPFHLHSLLMSLALFCFFLSSFILFFLSFSNSFSYVLLFLSLVSLLSFFVYFILSFVFYVFLFLSLPALLSLFFNFSLFS